MSRLILILFFAGHSLLMAQEQYVYKIRAEVQGEKPRILAGFCVKGIAGMVTSLHGVAASNNISAQSASNKVYKGLRIKQVDVKSDAAILSSPELETHADVGSTVGDATSLSPGEVVFVTGFPQGIDEHTRHIIVGYPPKKNLARLIPPDSSKDFEMRKSPSVDIDVIEFDSTSVPGHSGGPVWNKSGEVVCIANGGIVGADISWAVPLDPFKSVNKWPGVQAETDEMQRLSKLALRCFLWITQSVRFSHVIALRYACSRSNPA
jgi:S1-C subfamily serine protease